jgi:hypothetical protein
MKPAKYFVLLATVPVIAGAQDCEDIADDSERLACYDALHKPAQISEAPPPVSDAAPEEFEAVPEPEAAPKAVPLAEAPENFGLKEKRADGPKQALSARIDKVQKVGNADYLYLDNGQVWRELGGDSGVRFRAGREVTITEGALGSYNLSIEGQKRLTKVKRVR